ncbi:helix-turn-helix domain-containing protein [Caulobacter soli]|uniref:helix-turn-helix domain-containing protein n=1 Tax=Caulobacter soli TaxID=2708539 RepID=UPI0013E9AC4C|nr:helix-turn-helix domain-containing protein [Caulobacter soli]
MTTTFGQDLIASLEEALDHADGKGKGALEHVVEAPDVRSLREQLRMSQQEFSHAYKIPLPTLKGWEQGRRHPDATAAAFLNVIARLPKETQKALAA